MKKQKIVNKEKKKKIVKILKSVVENENEDQ